MRIGENKLRKLDKYKELNISMCIVRNVYMKPTFEIFKRYLHLYKDTVKLKYNKKKLCFTWCATYFTK